MSVRRSSRAARVPALRRAGPDAPSPARRRPRRAPAPPGAAPLTPPAPWRCDLRAVVWLQPVRRAALARLTGPIARHRWAPFAPAGLVVYRDTPVGPYGEVFTALATLDRGRPLGHVPFMAVDSRASLAGGRGNWALPKELARFDGPVIRGDGWGATITAQVRPRTASVVAAGRSRQPWPGGALRDFVASFRGSARLARVTVRQAPDADLPGWLTAGTYPAVALDGVADVLEPL